jgi:ubiquinone/menaquinone biosynthesis C-methylase UbiE
MKQASFPEMYERWLVRPLFRPWAEITLERIGLSAGDRVLDIACGTGIVARVAKERLVDTGSVVGVDTNPDMLAVARAVGPGIDWRPGNAMALPLQEGEQFNVVACQQGLQFFSDKPAAAAQMRAALAIGGRLAVSTWRPEDEIPFIRELRHVAEQHVGTVVDQRHNFGDAAALETLFGNAGFQDIQSAVISRTIRFEDGTPFLQMNTMALVGMSATGKTLGNDERNRMVEAIIDASATVLGRYADGSGLAFEMRTNLITAKR